MTTSSLPEPAPGNIIKLHTPISEVPPTLPTPKIRLSVPGTTVPEGFSNFGGNTPLRLVIPGKKVVPAQKKGLPEQDLKAINNALGKLVRIPIPDWIGLTGRHRMGLVNSSEHQSIQSESNYPSKPLFNGTKA
jgi:hypothetical protein